MGSTSRIGTDIVHGTAGAAGEMGTIDEQDGCEVGQWVRGYVLDAMCTVAAAAGDVGAPALADDMLRLAARTDMRELVVRAHLHRARLGIPGALDAAQMAAASIDNPALSALSAAGVAAR